MAVIFVLTAALTKAQIQCDTLYQVMSLEDTIEFKIKTFNCGARDYIIDFYTYIIPDKLEIWDTKADTLILGDVWLPDGPFPAPPNEPVINGPAIITPDGITYGFFGSVPFDTLVQGSVGLARYIIPQAEYDSLTIKGISNENPQTAFDFISYCINPPDYIHPVVYKDTLICNGQSGSDSTYISGLCADTVLINNYTGGGIELQPYTIDVCYGDSITPYPLHDTILYPDYILNTEPLHITDVITIEYQVFDGFCSAIETITYNPILTVEYGDTLVVADAGDQIQVPLCGFDEVFTELSNLYSCVYGAVVYQDTAYEVIMYNGTGCIYEYMVDVEVYEQIYIPNIFSPNSDGVNDVFAAQMSNNVISYELQVYDRWGKRLFRGQEAWNGKAGPYDVNPGTYVYIYTFVFDNDKQLTISGDVTVWR